MRPRYRKGTRSEAVLDTSRKSEETNIEEAMIVEATDQLDKTSTEMETKVQCLRGKDLQFHLTTSKVGEYIPLFIKEHVDHSPKFWFRTRANTRESELVVKLRTEGAGRLANIGDSSVYS
jgi:hypothetical protein